MPGHRLSARIHEFGARPLVFRRRSRLAGALMLAAACAGVGTRASVVMMAVSVTVGMVSTGLVMTGMRNGSAGSRMRW